MAQEAKPKAKQYKPRSESTITLKDFSETEQATMVLASHHKKQSIRELMMECIQKQIKTTITVTFDEKTVPQGT